MNDSLSSSMLAFWTLPSPIRAEERQRKELVRNSGVQASQKLREASAKASDLVVSKRQGPGYFIGWLSKLWPLVGPLNTRCRIVFRTQKGTIISLPPILLVSYTKGLSWWSYYAMHGDQIKPVIYRLHGWSSRTFRLCGWLLYQHLAKIPHCLAQ